VGFVNRKRARPKWALSHEPGAACFLWPKSAVYADAWAALARPPHIC